MSRKIKNRIQKRRNLNPRNNPNYTTLAKSHDKEPQNPYPDYISPSKTQLDLQITPILPTHHP